MKHPILLSITSGVLLALAFPYPGWAALAWIALVPFFYAIRSAEKSKHAIAYGAVTGIVFFSVSFHWLTHVTVVGWVLLVLMQAVYLMAFAWLVYWGEKTEWPAACKILWIAAAWTLLEFVRSEMPVFGLGWNLLAYSQAANPVVIQISNAIGAYGLSFLIVVVNVCVMRLFLPQKKRKRGEAAALFSVIIVILAGLYAYGEWSLREERKPEEYLRTTVLQGNIPQSLKWAPVAKSKIVEIYSKLTELASLDQTDLVIWPEAAFPGYFNRDTLTETLLKLPRTLQTPLLIGALYWEDKVRIFNSAYFIDKYGMTQQRYDKLKLVPFGEYIPLKPVFFWLTPIADALGISDFSAGKEPVIFEWARAEWPFGVLICFEDVLPALARDLANQGAKFIAVITNDAWFGKTSAAHQHLQASIFRAVENGVPVVRAANTGVSGFISYRGEVLETVKGSEDEEIFVAGQATFDLPLMTKDTVYRKGGYFFPYVVFIFFLGLGSFLIRRRIVS